jgi:hypothetical protein
VTSLARISALTMLAFAGFYGTSTAAQPGIPKQNGTAFPMCQVPLTKGYTLEPGFCPPQVAAMIPQAVADDGDCGCCGPFGIAPIYTAGNSVMVRTTPDVHERVARFLIDLGAYVPPRQR